MLQWERRVKHFASGCSPEFFRSETESNSDLGFNLRRETVFAEDRPAVPFVVGLSNQLSEFPAEQLFHATTLLKSSVVNAVLAILVCDPVGEEPVVRFKRKNLQAVSPVLRFCCGKTLPDPAKSNRLFKLHANYRINSQRGLIPKRQFIIRQIGLNTLIREAGFNQQLCDGNRSLSSDAKVCV